MNEGGVLVLLRKAKPVLHQLIHRSDFGTRQKIDREEPLEANETLNRNDSARRPLVVDDSFAARPPSLRDREMQDDTVPEIGSDLDFQAEIPAESFSKANPGEAARGTFQKVETVRRDDTETEWSPEEFDFDPPEKLADRRDSCPAPDREHQHSYDARRSTQNAIRSSVHEIRKAAAGRNWLSPKSIRALMRIEEGKSKLDRSDRNSLRHLLERFSGLPELEGHILYIRKLISE